MHKKLCLLVFFALIPFVGFSQERPVLDWAFFKNDRPNNGAHEAFTWCNIAYRYKPVKVVGENIEIEFTVTLTMDTARSYFDDRKKRLNDIRLLKHEQGHADIAFIYTKKLKDTFLKTTFLKQTYVKEIKNIWETIFAEMNAEQIKYDLETDHSKSLGAQKIWDVYFDKALQIP